MSTHNGDFPTWMWWLSYTDYCRTADDLATHGARASAVVLTYTSRDTPVEALEGWWRHHMETFSALLALCEGNPPVTGRFPSPRPVTPRFNAFFDLHLNKRLRKQSKRRWFETPFCSLWCHCNALCYWLCVCNCVLLMSPKPFRILFKWNWSRISFGRSNFDIQHGREVSRNFVAFRELTILVLKSKCSRKTGSIMTLEMAWRTRPLQLVHILCGGPVTPTPTIGYNENTIDSEVKIGVHSRASRLQHQIP